MWSETLKCSCVSFPELLHRKDTMQLILRPLRKHNRKIIYCICNPFFPLSLKTIVTFFPVLQLLKVSAWLSTLIFHLCLGSIWKFLENMEGQYRLPPKRAQSSLCRALLTYEQFKQPEFLHLVLRQSGEEEATAERQEALAKRQNTRRRASGEQETVAPSGKAVFEARALDRLRWLHSHGNQNPGEQQLTKTQKLNLSFQLHPLVAPFQEGESKHFTTSQK